MARARRGINMLHCTTISGVAPGLGVLDSMKADGLAKEITARLGALGLIAGCHQPDGTALCDACELVEQVIAEAAPNPANASAITKRLQAAEMIPGSENADAVLDAHQHIA